MDRLDAMTAFVTVADLAGFAPAARRLGLSASAVTRLVAALEERLGIRLLQRTTRSVSLTDAGSRYLGRARRILADVDEAEGAAQAERSAPTGRIVVAAPTTFGRRHVADLMCDFLSAHPAVSGELILADRLVNLVEEGVDVAVRIGVLADSTLVARAVGHTRRVVVASPAFLGAHGAPRTPQAITRRPVIQFTSMTPTPEWRFFHDGQPIDVPIAPRFVTNSADAAIAHAERGGGLAMVLAYQVIESVRAGRLRVVLARYEPPPLPIHLVYPTTRLLSAKVRALADLVSSSRDWRFADL